VAPSLSCVTGSLSARLVPLRRPAREHARRHWPPGDRAVIYQLSDAVNARFRRL